MPIIKTWIDTFCEKIEERISDEILRFYYMYGQYGLKPPASAGFQSSLLVFLKNKGFLSRHKLANLPNSSVKFFVEDIYLHFCAYANTDASFQANIFVKNGIMEVVAQEYNLARQEEYTGPIGTLDPWVPIFEEVEGGERPAPVPGTGGAVLIPDAGTGVGVGTPGGVSGGGQETPTWDYVPDYTPGGEGTSVLQPGGVVPETPGYGYPGYPGYTGYPAAQSEIPWAIIAAGVGLLLFLSK